MMKDISRRHALRQVYNDFAAIMALNISNCMAPIDMRARQKEQEVILKRYIAEELETIRSMIVCFGDIVNRHMEAPVDILGELYMRLDGGNKGIGQFFTPASVANAMGRMLITPHIEKRVQERGYLTVIDPAAGSGAMVLSLANALQARKLDHRINTVLTAVDIDIHCVYLAYVQMSLYGIPGVVIHGDSIQMQEWSRWYTPVYLLDDWVWRQRCGLMCRKYFEDELIRYAGHPMYGIMQHMPTILERLDKEHTEFAIKNTESHRRLWEHNVEQDAKLQEHDKRILTLENKKDH